MDTRRYAGCSFAKKPGHVDNQIEKSYLSSSSGWQIWRNDFGGGGQSVSSPATSACRSRFLNM